MDVSDLNGGVLLLPVGGAEMAEQLKGRWDHYTRGGRSPLIYVMVPEVPSAMSLADGMMRTLTSLGSECQFHPQRLEY